jgi:hypothetical protein
MDWAGPRILVVRCLITLDEKPVKISCDEVLGIQGV